MGSGFDPDVLATATFRAVHARVAQQPRIADVPRVTSPAELDALAAAGYPAVQRFDVASRDELMAVLRRHGDLTLTVRTGAYARPHDYVHDRRIVSMSLDRYLAGLERGPDGYAGNQQITVDLASQLGAGVPSCAPSAALEPPAMWLGPAGTVTPLHKDSSDNVAMQLFGVKAWTLFPVRDAPHLQLERVSSAPGFSDFAVSRIDLRHDAVPANTGPLRVEVSAGELLYIPAGWSHFVENVTASLMVNYWIDPLRAGPRALRTTP